MATNKSTVAIIGAGRVGTSLGSLLARLGYCIGGVVCRSVAKAQQAVDHIGAGTPYDDPGKGAQGADIVLVTVPDGAIESVIRQIATTRDFGPTDLLVHTSGALSADVLRVPGTHRAQCLSLHPIQTVADPKDGARQLRGAYFGVEGDPEAVEFGMDLVQRMGAKPLRIKPGAKALYHAAACMASNYLVTLIHASLYLYDRAGIERSEALDALFPLLTGTLDNVKHVGIPRCLTGPIDRADTKTVGEHLKALQQTDHLRSSMGDRRDGQQLELLYRVLGLHTIEIARQKSDRTADAYNELEVLLQDGGG